MLSLTINEEKFAKKMLEYEIHGSLKCGQDVRQPKEHNKELKVAIMGAKCSFLNVIGMNSNLIVPIQQIEFRKEKSTVEIIKKFLHCVGMGNLSFIVIKLKAL